MDGEADERLAIDPRRRRVAAGLLAAAMLAKVAGWIAAWTLWGGDPGFQPVAWLQWFHAAAALFWLGLTATAALLLWTDRRRLVAVGVAVGLAAMAAGTLVSALLDGVVHVGAPGWLHLVGQLSQLLAGLVVLGDLRWRPLLGPPTGSAAQVLLLVTGLAAVLTAAAPMYRFRDTPFGGPMSFDTTGDIAILAGPWPLSWKLVVVVSILVAVALVVAAATARPRTLAVVLGGLVFARLLADAVGDRGSFGVAGTEPTMYEPTVWPTVHAVVIAAFALALFVRWRQGPDVGAGIRTRP